MEEIRLTPKEWVEETKKCLIDQNKMLGSKKAIRANDYKYIGMAVIVAEFVNRIGLVVDVGTKIEYMTNNNWCKKGQIDTVLTVDYVNNKIRLGDQFMSLKGYMENIKNGNFKVIS
jgi:hypothetical protein